MAIPKRKQKSKASDRWVYAPRVKSPPPPSIDINEPRRTRPRTNTTESDAAIAAPPPPAKKVKKIVLTPAEKALAKQKKEDEEVAAYQAGVKALAAIEDRAKKAQREEERDADRPDLALMQDYRPLSPAHCPPTNTINGEKLVVDEAGASSEGDYIPSGSPESEDDGLTELFSDEENRAQYRELRKIAKAKSKAKKVSSRSNGLMLVSMRDADAQLCYQAAKGALRTAVNEQRKTKPTVHSAARSKAIVVDGDESESEIAIKSAISWVIDFHPSSLVAHTLHLHLLSGHQRPALRVSIPTISRASRQRSRRRLLPPMARLPRPRSLPRRLSPLLKVPLWTRRARLSGSPSLSCYHRRLGLQQ